MLSCMTTAMGITVIGPTGKAVRVARSNPVYPSVTEIVRSALPAAQSWAKLQELLANPLQALASWALRSNVIVAVEGDTLKLNDLSLKCSVWQPFLGRCMATGGSARAAMLLADQLREVDVGAYCWLYKETATGAQVKLLKQQQLPGGASTGDFISPETSGDTPFLVSYDVFEAAGDGGIILRSGTVVSKIVSQSEAADVLAQPMVLGLNQTYRCEEGDTNGWMEDLSFDSLTAARANLQEMKTHAPKGSEVRIINRISGEPVPG